MMSIEARRGSIRASMAFAVLLFAGATAEPGDPVSAFSSAAMQAMDRMMSDMHRPATGDVDRDFVNMMVPHHQGAIDMAIAELRYGRNAQLKRIAQEIIVDQQQEIAAMDSAVGATLPKPWPAPTQQPSNSSQEQ
jgi:uncharacterized protein (DUF305 family)